MVENENIAVFGLLTRGEQILIVKRKKNEVGSNGKLLTWGFPGGKIEPGETMEDAVAREVYEETGFSVHVDEYVSERVHPDFPVRAVYFSCSLVLDTPDAVSDGSTVDMCWVKLSDLSNYFTSELDSKVKSFLLGDV